MNATDERTAFLHAIRLDPFADLPRLVFADWLEEHDEPGYARFIRGHCQPDTRGNEIRLNSGGAVVNDGELCAAADALIPSGATIISRGFVARIELTAKQFMAHAALLFDEHPVVDITLSDRVPWQFSPTDLCDLGWYREHFSQAETTAHIPAPVFDVMAAKMNVPAAMLLRHKARNAESLLKTWLSRACVAYGRAAAFLPPLEFP